MPNGGETVLKAVAGECIDESFIRKGYFLLNDKLAKIMKTPEGNALFTGMMMQFGTFTVIRLLNTFAAGGMGMSKEQMLGLNAMLNQIKKPQA